MSPRRLGPVALLLMLFAAGLSAAAQTTVVVTQRIAVAPPLNAGQGPIGTVTSGATRGGIGGADVGQGPARDQPSTPVVGTSVIRGRVVAADTGRPLRRATVRLNAPNVREQRSTTTDLDGRYEFTQLAPAGYLVIASKTGYVQMGYKQPRPNTTQRPLTLGDRQTLERVDIQLPPAGVILGRIVDEFGEPVSDVMVSAQRQQFVNGIRRPMTSGAPASSNDIGEFRLYGLAPGDYYVSAQPRASMNPFEVSTDRSGYGQTYYPSAPDAASAQRLTVSSGDVVSNIVIALSPARMARVSGTVLGSDLSPAKNGNIMAMSAEGFGPPIANAQIRPDGTFTFNGLPPGSYTLRTIPTGPAGPGQMPTSSTVSIIVNGADLQNVVLQPQAPVSVAGRLVGDPAVLAQIRPSATRMMLSQAAPMMFAGPLPPPPPLSDDLSFDVNTFPGSVILRATGFSGVAIRSIRLNGRDVTKGFEVPANTPITDLEVEVTAASAKVVVAAMNPRAEPIVDRDIVVFPQDEAKWGVQMPGYISVGRTDEQGRYQSSPMVAGAYYVADTDPIEAGQSGDPDFLESIRIRAQRLVLADGETANVQVKVGDR